MAQLLQTLIGQLLGGTSTLQRNPNFSVDASGNPTGGNPYQDPNFVTRLFFPNVASEAAAANAAYANQPAIEAQKNLIARNIWGKNFGDVQSSIGKDLTDISPEIGGLLTRGDTTATNIESQRQAQRDNANGNLFDLITNSKILNNLKNNIGTAASIVSGNPQLEATDQNKSLLYNIARTTGLSDLLPATMMNEAGRIGSEMERRPFETAANIASAKRESTLAPLSTTVAANEFNRTINNSGLLDTAFTGNLQNEVTANKLKAGVLGQSVNDQIRNLETMHNESIMNRALSGFGAAPPLYGSRITPEGVTVGITPGAMSPEFAKLQYMMGSGMIPGSGSRKMTATDSKGNPIPTPPTPQSAGNLIYSLGGGQPTGNSVSMAPSVQPTSVDNPITVETPKDMFDNMFNSTSHNNKRAIFENLVDEISKNIVIPEDELRYGSSAFLQEPKDYIMKQLTSGSPEVQKAIQDRFNQLPREQQERIYANAISKSTKSLIGKVKK